MKKHFCLEATYFESPLELLASIGAGGDADGEEKLLEICSLW